jgi:glutathione S-transferase
MAQRVRVIGSYLSPYVRKVLACLHVKGIAYEIDPIIPFMGDERFTARSPLRRIPVLIDDQVTLCDSSVICQYLEDRHPEPRLYPRDPALAARARWLEEFADTRMGEVFIWRLYNQLVIRRFVWNEEPDRELVRKTLETDIPTVLDYLESQLPEPAAGGTQAGFALGDLSIADLSLASFFRNAAFARFTVDAARWPRTSAYVERVLGLEIFQRLRPLEEKLIRTPIPGHRQALIEMGAPITAETLGTQAPRRGVMST